MNDTIDVGNLVDAILAVQGKAPNASPEDDSCGSMTQNDLACSPDNARRPRQSMKAAAAGLDASAAPSGAPDSPAPVPEGYLLVGTQDDTPEPGHAAGDAEVYPSSALSPQPSATVMESAIKVTVKEPERLEASAALGLKTQHWVYAITTDSTLPGLVASNVMVRRRFSEFEALHKVLSAEYIGCFLPPLPQKAFIEDNTEDFLRGRRQDLQVYLRAIVAHPILQTSEALKVFLLQPSELARNPAWNIIASSVVAANRRPGLTSALDSLDMDDFGAGPQQSGSSVTNNGALDKIGSWMSRVKQSTVAVFQPNHRKLPADEPSLRQAKELLQDLQRLLELATQGARTLCIDMDKLGSDFHDFGYQMASLAKYEEVLQAKVGRYTTDGHSASHRGADCQALAMCQAKQSMAWKTLALKCAANLVTLQDYCLLMPEAVRAMEEREAALQHMFQIEDELATKRHQLEQLQHASAESNKGLLRSFSVGTGTLSRQEKKSYQVSQAIGVLEDDLKGAQAMYNVIKARNKSELTRLGLEREADFRSMMASFSSNQAKLIYASANIWQTLADKLGRDASVSHGSTSPDGQVL